MTKRSLSLYLLMIAVLLIGAAGCSAAVLPAEPELTPASTEPSFTGTSAPSATSQPSETPLPTRMPGLIPFDGRRAYEDVVTQVDMGPRIPETAGHAEIQEWMQQELARAGWKVEVQESEALGHPIENIVARRTDEAPQIILGAHYDTRIFADNDPDPAQRANHVPGANDGASGVAVLLELARTLPEASVPLWLVFFDAEDNGRIEGWEWILGSREFVANNPIRPGAVIIVDMIGDADLNIYKERNSNPNLTDEIWAVAEELGHADKFIAEYKHSLLDDHTPFIEAGIPAIDIIDFDYPYYHTVQDTPDKVSAESLQAVGETLHTWIMQQSTQP